MRGLKFLPTDTANLSINNATTGTGSVVAYNDCRQVIAFLEYNTSTPPTTGVIVLEWAHEADYAGAWSNLNTLTLANVVAGTEDPGLTYPGGLPFVRARFTTPADQAVTYYTNGDLN